MDPALCRLLVRALCSDKHLSCIYMELTALCEKEPAEDPVKNGFCLDPATGLLYMLRGSSEHLCIPASANTLILRAAHDFKGHPGIQKTQA